MIFADLMNNYCDKVSQFKRGADKEILRIQAFNRRDPLAKLSLEQVTPQVVAEWRDRRLNEVSPGTVNREWNILSNACNVAVKEWCWMSVNPFANLRRPRAPAPRDTVFASSDADSILRKAPKPVADVFRFALETAMRASEITGLRWKDVGDKVVSIPITKNGSKRVVPLSVCARQILSGIPRGHEDQRVFGLDSEKLGREFRKARRAAGLDEHHFHDARRTALTHLATKLGPMELAKVSGHKDLKILLNTYYAPDMAAMADRLG